MKKILLLLLALLTLGACSKTETLTPTAEPTSTPTATVEATEETATTPSKADMSGYTTLTDKNHVYVEITMSDLEKMINDKESFVAYFGYTTCPWCLEVVPVLNDVAKLDGTTVYYIDVHNSANSGEQALDYLTNLLTPVLEPDENGDVALYVPDVFAVKDGEIVDNHVSTVEGHNAHEREMTEEEKQQLIQILTELVAKAK